LDFPKQTEHLVMNVAANQLAVMLQQGKFLSEQKRVALELNERVAQRTVELAAANQELRKEITERKEIEEQLRESETFIAEAQHLARIGSFSWLVATDEIKWSELLYRIFEFELGAPITFDLIGSRVHPEDLRSIYDMIAKARRAVSDYEYEYRLLMSDRSIKHLHLIAHASRDREGQFEYIGAIQDVTQRRLSARSELAQGARITSIGVLTASIAHEVNQPLSGIITNASTCLRMLSADPPNVDGARETATHAS
jgi:C4-dicarboxylate-specific signal transduction histidine kinase